MTSEDRRDRLGRTTSAAALVGLLACASCAHAPRGVAGDLGEDAAPQVPAFSFHPADPEALYSERDADASAASPVDRDYFPRFENGEIRPPRRYEVEKRFSARDARLMRGALAVAHRYADVNAAFADGYRPEERFGDGAGIHMLNVASILRGDADAERPQFLTYVKNRRTGRFELLLLGYLHLGRERVRLFDSPEARGRLRRGRCLYVADDIVRFRDFVGGESCDPSRGDHPADSFWIMNFAVALYNERGLFADDFPLADRLSEGEDLYYFYGARQTSD